MARRSGISPSTVSRVGSGLIAPSLKVVEKISRALGMRLELRVEETAPGSRLTQAKAVLNGLRKELASCGVKHAVIFGSIARGEGRSDSDVDVFLDFGENLPRLEKMLKAEGRVIQAFGEGHVDVVSDLKGPKMRKLKSQIEEDGIRAF